MIQSVNKVLKNILTRKCVHSVKNWILQASIKHHSHRDGTCMCISLPVSAFSDLLNNLAKKNKTYRTILVLDSFKEVLVKS